MNDDEIYSHGWNTLAGGCEFYKYYVAFLHTALLSVNKLCTLMYPKIQIV